MRVERSKYRQMEQDWNLVQMVSKHSAVPSKPTEDPHDQLSRDVDHSGISKFQDRSDQDYVVFRQRIVDCTQVDTAPLQERYIFLITYLTEWDSVCRSDFT